MLQTVFVGTDDGLYAGVDTSLRAGGCLLDTHLGQTGLDGLGHTAELLNLLDVLPSLVHEFVGQGLYVVRTCPRVDLLADLSLVLDVDLGVTGDTSREVCRQGDGLVERIGVERLSMTQHGCHGLDTSTAYVVEGILLGETPTRGLRVSTQGE